MNSLIYTNNQVKCKVILQLLHHHLHLQFLKVNLSQQQIQILSYRKKLEKIQVIIVSIQTKQNNKMNKAKKQIIMTNSIFN